MMGNGIKKIFQKTDDIEIDRNAFDLLRYWAALSVMIGHFCWVYGRYAANPPKGLINLLSSITGIFPGVVVFFTLSGFLVSASVERSKSEKVFITKRLLRIFPELWMCSLANLIVVCVLVPCLLDSSMIIWLLTQIVGFANTPSCLDGWATGSINGSLWTITINIQFYLIALAFCSVFKRMSHRQWLAFLAAAAVINYISDTSSRLLPGIVAQLYERTFVPYGLWFFIGCYTYYKRQKIIPLFKRFSVPLLVLYCILLRLKVSLPGQYVGLHTGILVPVIVIGLAYLLPPIRLRTDLTYGIFLYHWIVLNIMVHFDFMNRVSFSVCLGIYLLLVMMVSFCSWRFIGKPSIGWVQVIQEKLM